ncbi:hypothetical protein L596_006974 [Steinernema carpocapsae]|uniref:G-protein coupled receptors family 1 profile domain-containing protein n=1 Tax=Steinernema carpocapsae TaxID=34508 RepID=A0A4U5P8I7_STECR|nr:hypothetical protein L596_006974 [Steinernema carpocapsae]
MKPFVFVIGVSVVLLFASSTLLLLAVLVKTHKSLQHPLFAVLLFTDALCSLSHILSQILSILVFIEAYDEYWTVRFVIFFGTINRAVIIFYNLALIGFVAQRILYLIFPLSPGIHLRFTKFVLPFAAIFSFLYLLYDNAVIILGFATIPETFPEGCWDSRCALIVAPFYKFSFISLTTTLLILNILLGSIFLILIRVKAQQILKNFKMANTFLKYQLCSHIFLVLVPLLTDLILSSVFNIQILNYVGPYVVLTTSLDGFICAAIYFFLNAQRRVLAPVQPVTFRTKVIALKCVVKMAEVTLGRVR